MVKILVVGILCLVCLVVINTVFYVLISENSESDNHKQGEKYEKKNH